MNAETAFALTNSFFSLLIISFYWKVRFDSTLFRVICRLVGGCFLHCNYYNSSWCISVNEHHRPSPRSVRRWQFAYHSVNKLKSIVNRLTRLDSFPNVSPIGNQKKQHIILSIPKSIQKASKKSIINFLVLSMSLSNYQI